MHNEISGTGARNANKMTPPNLQNGHLNLSKEIGEAEGLTEICARINEKMERFLRQEAKTEIVRQTQEQTKISLGVITEALEKYTPDALSLSYNGGKDCLVLLVLYLSALHDYSMNKTSKKPSAQASTHSMATIVLPQTLESIYIIPSDPFPEVDTFVAQTSKQYHLSLHRSTAPMKEAFSTYLDSAPSVRAIFVGTRRTDPHGHNLTFFDPTDGGWPAFMRIHPVIDWHYAEVWTFIRELGVDYCPLYDQGYTSLGGTKDTLPNPALKDDSGKGHRPAYELVEDEEERLGRDR